MVRQNERQTEGRVRKRDRETLRQRDGEKQNIPTTIVKEIKNKEIFCIKICSFEA
jgi:hypothetical protein